MAKNGDTVKVDYTGTLADGTVFDTSAERQPLEFTLGQGSVIPGFENAVNGMEVGQSKTVTIPSTEAYGPYREDMKIVIERNQLPPDISPEAGQQLLMQQPNGGSIRVIVTDVSDTAVTLDANHPLAGKDLTFEIKLVEVEK